MSAQVIPDPTRLVALEMEQHRHEERQALDHVAHYQALGIGLAAMCQIMYDTLIQDTRLSHADVVSILRAAVRGR